MLCPKHFLRQANFLSADAAVVEPNSAGQAGAEVAAGHEDAGYVVLVAYFIDVVFRGRPRIGLRLREFHVVDFVLFRFLLAGRSGKTLPVPSPSSESPRIRRRCGRTCPTHKPQRRGEQLSRVRHVPVRFQIFSTSSEKAAAFITRSDRPI